MSDRVAEALMDLGLRRGGMEAKRMNGEGLDFVRVMSRLQTRPGLALVCTPSGLVNLEKALDAAAPIGRLDAIPPGCEVTHYKCLPVR